MSSTPLILPFQTPVNGSGRPYANATLTVYLAGTTTLTTIYSDSDRTTPLSNPVSANSAGRFPPIYASPENAVRMILKNSSGSTLADYDDIPTTPELTAAAIGAATNGLTDAETAAGIGAEDIDTAYYPGDPRRYGAVLDGSTDDSAAFNLAADQFEQPGGADIRLPHGYSAMLSSQWTVARPSYRNCAIHAYGFEIFTTGAISALKITGGSQPHACTVYGLKINHRANATATAGIHLSGTSHVSLVDCVVEGDDNSATYAAVLVENSTAADPDTGCFWTRIERFRCRQRSGSDGAAPTVGVLLRGAANATIIRDSSFADVTGVLFEKHSGQTYVANGTVIDGCAFEGCTNAIKFTGDTTSTFSGHRITNNRCEATTTFLELTGSTSQPAVPMWLSGNYMISSITNYIVNVNDIYINNFDFSITPTMRAVATVTGATKANPCSITAVAHPFVTGQKVKFATVGGMTELNGNTYTVTRTGVDTFTIGVDSSGYTTYTSGGTATEADFSRALRASDGLEIIPNSGAGSHALTLWSSGAGLGLQFRTNAGADLASITWGTGAPGHSAAKGSLYLRADGGANTCLYVNESGSTTWVAK